MSAGRILPQSWQIADRRKNGGCMQNISREAEEKHLTSTLAIIENHLKHYEKESGRMQ